MTSTASSGLGRYADAGGDGTRLVEVRLVNFPLAVYVRAYEHHQELMREFALLALAPPIPRPGHDVPARLLELIEVLGRRYAASADDTDAVRDAAIARGETAIDLTYTVPESARDACLRLGELMDAADEFCRDENLLTLASEPDEVAFRRWYLDEFVRQIDGAEPTPWRGPLA